MSVITSPSFQERCTSGLLLSGQPDGTLRSGMFDPLFGQWLVTAILQAESELSTQGSARSAQDLHSREKGIQLLGLSKERDFLEVIETCQYFLTRMENCGGSSVFKTCSVCNLKMRHAKHLQASMELADFFFGQDSGSLCARHPWHFWAQQVFTPAQRGHGYVHLATQKLQTAARHIG